MVRSGGGDGGRVISRVVEVPRETRASDGLVRRMIEAGLSPVNGAITHSVPAPGGGGDISAFS